MKVLLDDLPIEVLTRKGKEALIEAAKEWDADYLVYATKYDDIHYFLFGVFKDMRPRFWGFPHFVSVENGKILNASYSINIELMSRVDPSLFNRLSTD